MVEIALLWDVWSDYDGKLPTASMLKTAHDAAQRHGQPMWCGPDRFFSTPDPLPGDWIRMAYV